MRRRARNLTVAVAMLVLAVFGGRWLMLGSASGTAGAADLRALKPGQHRVAVVFGAGLAPGGGVSPLLDDRLRAAEDLLHRRVVDRLLMTGDNSVPFHNEPGAMRLASMRRGVPEVAIAVDYGGRRTWDSCVRARRIFGVRNAVLVSSDFHRARTIVECRAAGLHVDGAVGASTAHFGTSTTLPWRIRELAASWRGVWDSWIDHPPVPVGGTPIDIYDPAAVRASLSPADRAATP